VHRKYIYGGHIAAYMNTLTEDEPEKYQTHFSEYIKRGIEADNIEALYKKVHAAIRANPVPTKSAKQPPKQHKRYINSRLTFVMMPHQLIIICLQSRYNLKKLTYEQRKNKLIERLNAFNSAADVDDDQSED